MTQTEIFEDWCEALWEDVSLSLRRMDEEATTAFPQDGGRWTAGLRRYDKHYRVMHSGLERACEPAWTHRLAELLRESDYRTRVLDPFPATRPAAVSPTGVARTALLVERGGVECAVELVGAWVEDFRLSGGRVVEDLNADFGKQLYGHTRAAFADLARVRPETPRVAHGSAVLLVGFDSSRGALANAIGELRRELPLGWSGTCAEEWREKHYGTFVRTCFWHRPATVAVETGVA